MSAQQPSLFDAPELVRAEPIPDERALQFRVFGEAITQGSGTPVVSRTTGRAFMKRSNEGELQTWRQDIAKSALAARGPLAGVLLEGPVRLVVLFRLPRRIAWGKRARLAFVAKRPDFDKLTRAVADALTGVVYIDDGQITTCTILKRPARLGEPAGIDVAVGPDVDASFE